MSTTRRHVARGSGISIEIPDAWTLVDWGDADPLQGIKLVAPSGDAGIVVEQAARGQHAHILSYSDGLIASLTAIMPQFKLLSTTPATVQGRCAVRFHFSYSDQTEREDLHVVLERGESVLSLYLDASSTGFAGHLAAFEAVVASLEFLSDPDRS